MRAPTLGMLGPVAQLQEGGVAVGVGVGEAVGVGLGVPPPPGGSESKKESCWDWPLMVTRPSHHEVKCWLSIAVP